MKYLIYIFAVCLPVSVCAAPVVSNAALNQNLVSVEYASEGKQTGCGLRATAENKDHLTLNALITVFLKDTGATFGVVKVVARKVKTKNGAPVMKGKNVTYQYVGTISKPWFKTDSAAQPKVYSQGAAHNDGYMETVDFKSTVDLLLLMSQENFKIGFNLNAGQPDQVFIFDQWMDRREGNAFAACMANLTNEIDEGKKKRSL